MAGNNVAQHNRNVMLNRVKTVWLNGVLAESLLGGELLDLGFAYRPSAVANGHGPSWQQGPEYDVPLPLGTTISNVFAAAERQLLVMGEPGAGKTTMLLQLVNDLLTIAERNENEPIPVVFNLASWETGRALADWLTDELSDKYEVPRKLGQRWLAQQQFVPLLDGLDEVERSQRGACADAINVFRQSHPGVSMLVTTRSRDYQALAKQLQLDKAIVLQPLSLEQIDEYLASRGQRLAGLRAALQRDANLRELAQTPLMLSIMTLAYYRMPADIAISISDRELSRRLLFDVYVERMTRYRSGDKAYDPGDAVRWLSWLARMMSQQNRTLFFLENIQPNWLPPSERRNYISGLKRLVLLGSTGIGLVAGVLGVPAYGWPAVVFGLIAGALLGLLPVLSGRLVVRSPLKWDIIETVETLDWSWPWAWLALGVGTVTGFLVGAPLTLISDRAIPWWLLLPLLFSGALMLDFALLRSEVKLRTEPGLGIARSAQNGRVVALVGALGLVVVAVLVLGLVRILGVSVDWLAVLPWLAGGALYLGLMSGLVNGGLAAVQHRRLLSLLRESAAVPPSYVHFLDYAAERNLLRKVGGGYSFVHAMLLDYFRRQAPVEAF